MYKRQKSRKRGFYLIFGYTMVIPFCKPTYYYTFFGLITRRSEVRILPPLLPRKPESRREALLNEGFFVLRFLNFCLSDGIAPIFRTNLIS